mgnify:CR=1 FL=1
MNILDHYEDLMECLTISAYPEHFDGPTPEVDPRTGEYDTEQVGECCGYLTDLLMSHLETVFGDEPQ